MNQLSFTIIDSCRVCKSFLLFRSIELGSLVSCGIFQKLSDAQSPSGLLNLAICEECLLVQTDRNFNLDELFKIEYGYESSLNSTMSSHLKNIIEEFKSCNYRTRSQNYLDIGSNDGTLINYVVNEQLFDKHYAVDPTISKFRKQYSKEVYLFPDFFSFKMAQELDTLGGNFDLVTSIAMFYDLPDPNDFVQGITHLLAPNGIWILELSYLYSMINALAFDTICHEHLQYYSVKSLKYLIELHKLKIVKIEKNDSNGGSMRLHISHVSANYEQLDLTYFLDMEDSNAQEVNLRLHQMMKEVDKNIILVREFIESALSKNNVLHGLGASTKGNTFLQYAGLGKRELPFIAEVNQKKYGKVTPGTRIPIISENDSESMEPNFYLVLPWHFRENIISKKKDFMLGGGKLIFVFPKFEVISINDTEKSS